MDRHLLGLVQKYKRRGILIDTNLALLYIVGSLDSLLIRNHARTSAFSIDDFDRLSRFVDYFEKKIVTPHVLTETSNLLGKSVELRGVFGAFINSAKEIPIPAKSVAATSAFLAAGLTDAGILSVAEKKYLLVTDDGPLLGLSTGAKVDCVSLAQIRSI